MNGIRRPLFDEQRSYIDVDAIQSNQFIFNFENIDEWQCNCAAIVPGVSNLTFANDQIVIGNMSVQLVFESSEHGEEVLHRGANPGMPGDGRR